MCFNRGFLYHIYIVGIESPWFQVAWNFIKETDDGILKKVYFLLVE